MLATRTITVNLQANASGMVSGFRTAQSAAQGFASSTSAFAQENRQSLEAVGGAGMIAGGVLVAGFGKAVQTFASFDKAMSSVKAATHESAANMELLSDAAIKAGADTAFSAEESAQAIEELAKAGVATADILNGGLDGALSLAAAGALGVGESAELAATAMTQFGLAGKDIPHIADLLAAGAGKAQGSVQDMGMALKQAGLVADQTGLTIEETTGGLAAFASAGLIGSDAGTSFKSMLQRLNPQSKEADKLMGELGLSAYDAQGDFIGLSEYAGELQKALGGMTNEQRNATMGTLFGSDAVRAAAVLYEQGAEGVQKWEDAVNSAGYAAETAALMQDNLAGDLEKLGGAFDTVFLKAGGTGNDGLRALVQTAEDAVDAIGKIPEPVLGAIGVVAGLTGGALLLGGAFVTLAPRVFETVGHFRAMRQSAPGVTSALGKMGKAMGVAAAAFVAFEIAKSVNNSLQPATKSVEEFTGALVKMKNDAGAVDSIFSQLEFAESDMYAGQIDSYGAALDRLVNQNFKDAMASFGSDNNFANGVTVLTDAMAQQDAALTSMVSSGNMESASSGFKAMAESASKYGIDVQAVADRSPDYINSLRGIANSAGVVLGTTSGLTEEQELLNWAMGQTPPAMLAAASASEETATAIGGLGGEAAAAAVPLEDIVEALFALGMISMSSRDSTAAFHQALRDMHEATVAAANGTLGLGAVLNGTATDFDLTTEAGAAANAAFQNIAAAGMTDVEAKAREGMGQPELQANLRTTYDSLVHAAGGMGIVGGDAEALARKVFGIPDNVDIDSWMSDSALKIAQSSNAELDAFDGRSVTATQTLNKFTNHTMTETLNRIRTGDTSAPAAFNMFPGAATGGRISDIRGFAGGGQPGGRINYPAPSDLRRDNVLGMVNGKPVALQGQEWIINGRSSIKYDAELAQINAGTFPKQAGYAGGGRVGREYSAPATAPASNSVSAPLEAQLVGNLYLDSGEFLGKVRGIAREESDGVVGRIDTTMTRLGRGGKYSGRT